MPLTRKRLKPIHMLPCAICAAVADTICTAYKVHDTQALVYLNFFSELPVSTCDQYRSQRVQPQNKGLMGVLMGKFSNLTSAMIRLLCYRMKEKISL
ncbi:hypothetical protein IW261DRAFT_1496232 [Armillaria novae-zelandiae]|uniref:Secreted protein n=1 Tax=Armillaria novae-zelandiae TaxID=153914 RepID=A0AA39P0T7_9AGAR|nr:hypothetical protein IW261DRAFT_1496232 [Armillaria novae-zelandiae]